MAAKNRKELKENELAGALSENLEKIKPYLPLTLLGFVVLALIVFGINYFIASRSAAREAKSMSMIMYAVEQSSAGSLSTLDKQIEDFPEDNSAAWAYLLKADSQLAQGLDTLFVDKTAALDRIKNSLSNFEKAFEQADDDQVLKERSLYGWARALESLGEFGKASEKYNQFLEDMPESEFCELAKLGIERVSDEDNRQFYTVFMAKDNNVFSATDPGEEAPATNTGLPSRPDFTYPGEEVVIGGAPGFPTGDPAPGTDPEITRPEITRPEITGPEITEPKTTKPDDKDSTPPAKKDEPPAPPEEAIEGDKDSPAKPPQPPASKDDPAKSKKSPEKSPEKKADSSPPKAGEGDAAKASEAGKAKKADESKNGGGN